jgi:hypothetical protein
MDRPLTEAPITGPLVTATAYRHCKTKATLLCQELPPVASTQST